MMTEVEWEMAIERHKRHYLEGDAEDRAFWLGVWERTRAGLHATADAWERLRSASAQEIAENRKNAERYTDLIEWSRHRDAPVQPSLILEAAE